VVLICLLLGFNSRQAYYKRLKKLKKEEESSAKIIAFSNRIRRIMPETGTRKLYLDIKEDIEKEGLNYGRDKVHKVLKDNDLLVKPKKNYKVTTDSSHRYRKYKNLLKELEITGPEQVLVNDITYIRIGDQFSYLFLVTDAYSKKILGWTLNYTMKVKDGKKAILMAHKNRILKGELIHHSDRGIQYCTPSYISYIEKKGMKVSMTEEAHVYENAIAERVNGILKSEFGIGNGFSSLKEARAVIAESIFIYNQFRRHMSLDNLTPNYIHQHPVIKMKEWKSRRKYNSENQQIS